MKKKFIFGILAFAVLAVGAIFVVAQKAGHRDDSGFGHGLGRGGLMGMALRGLDLTDEQKAKVKEIMEASRASVEPLMQQMHDNHAKIAALGTDGAFDQAKVEALAAEQGNIMAKLIVEKEKAKAQVFAFLTDEQKAKAAEMRTKFEQKMKDHKGFMGRRHGSEF
ncbi:MAG: Spy/CpxP family protein refolding chaperone [Pyrinomonadaceae bacterium]